MKYARGTDSVQHEKVQVNNIRVKINMQVVYQTLQTVYILQHV